MKSRTEFLQEQGWTIQHPSGLWTKKAWGVVAVTAEEAESITLSHSYTWAEYRDAIEIAKNRAWLSGYDKACDMYDKKITNLNKQWYYISLLIVFIFIVLQTYLNQIP